MHMIFLEYFNNKEQNSLYLCSLYTINQKVEVKWGTHQVANVASPLVTVYFLETRHLSACCTSLPGCPASYMSSTELIISLYKLILIFIISVKSTNTLTVIQAGNWGLFLLLSSFSPEPINCFNYQSCLCSISPIHSFFFLSNLVIHVTITTLLDYGNH